MISFTCRFCMSALQAEESQTGKMVRCPTCRTTMTVPPPMDAAGMMKAASDRGFHQPGRRYGFNCPFCSSRLEANETMAAQEGQCPTCGNAIIIPMMDRHGRLIDPITKKIIKPDPHPVHAYAAAGARAPVIRRTETGHPVIICPRCRAGSPVTANNCRACGMPFTMDGTTNSETGNTNGFCVASLVLGIIGILGFLFVIPSLLAVIFGITGYTQAKQLDTKNSGKNLAIAGMTCGVVGLMLAVWRYLH
jgi:DNA-directed RNA polymerase subunit RPC12/RpoP